MTPRVVIVGAGLMGRWHAHACRRAGGRVAAVVDVRADAARALAARVGQARVVPSLDDLPADEPIDIVHVCSPLEAHEDGVRAALRRRCPAIVEKPVAATASATAALAAEARAAGTWIVPVHQTVFQDGIVEARAWLARAGPLRLFDYLACSAGAAPGDEDRIAREILPHPLSLVDALVPGGLAGVSWRVDRAAPGEWMVAATTAGTNVRVLLSMHGRPPRHELRLVADGGSLTADLFHGFAWDEPARTSRAYKIVRPFTASASAMSRGGANLARRALRREPAYPGLTTLVRRAYAAIADPSRCPLDDAHLIGVAEARDAIIGLARDG